MTSLAPRLPLPDLPQPRDDRRRDAAEREFGPDLPDEEIEIA